MYGKRNTFEDAKDTVSKFLDDFYDDGKGNYNQSFLNLERRLQEYFGYKPQGADGNRRPDDRDERHGDGADTHSVRDALAGLLEQAIYDYVADSYGLSEAELPSWSTTGLAGYLADALNGGDYRAKYEVRYED